MAAVNSRAEIRLLLSSGQTIDEFATRGAISRPTWGWKSELGRQK
jgi:hypothetical protein